MKIVLLNSSGRANGNTARLLTVLENQMMSAAERRHLTLEIRHVRLSAQNIGSCRGCRSCFEKGECPFQDDVGKIAQSVSDCDALILASPVYLEDVNGIMKNWMDRMAFYSHRPAFYGKYAVAISTSGSGSSSHSLNTMKNALTAWGFHVFSARKFRMGALMEQERIEKQYASTLSNIATDLVAAIQNDTARKPTLFSLISFHIQQKYYRTCDRAGIADRTYWEKKGWLDPQQHFYFSARCNPVKVLAARVLGAFLSKLFI